MKTFTINNIRKVLQNKKELEEKLKIKISATNNMLTIQGEELDEFITEKVFEAIDLGFSFKTALVLTDEDYMFETINIRSLNRNPKVARARIIGTKRKTLDTIEELTKCKLVLHENKVGIIGNNEDVRHCLTAVTNIVRGTKQANAYKFLEIVRRHKKPFILGLKHKEE